MPAIPTTIGRRATLAGLALAGLTTGRALAQGPNQAPKVWLDMDQKALDDAYDQAVYAPNIQQVIGRYATNSEAVRARLAPPQRDAYGASGLGALDIFPPPPPNSPVPAFIHGCAPGSGL